MNKRVIALILSAALLCSPCTAYAAEMSSTPKVADSGISVVDSGMKEPNYYSAAYADYLLKLDNANAEKGSPTKLWLSYMIKWKKAIPYKQTPDNYVYQPHNPKARAATIPISSLPMGAKIADRDTKWYGETLIWIKISNDVLQPKEGENTTPTNITIKGQRYDWTVKSAVNNTKQLWVTEQSIARIPVNEEQSPAYQGSDMYNWYKPGGGDPYEIFGFNFYDGVLSADLKRYTVPSVPTLYEYRENLLKNKYVRTGLEYVAPPPYGGYGQGVDEAGYTFPYMAKSLYTVTKRTTTHPVKIMPLLYQDTCSSHQDKPVIGIDWPGRVVTSQFYHHYDAGNDYNDYWFNGTNTTMSTGTHYRFYQCRSGAHPSGDVRPTIALKGTAQAYATPDSSGVYTLVPSLATPTLSQSYNAGTNKSTITASAAGATSMQITYGGAVVATANGSSITYAATKNGSYTTIASNGSASLSAATNVTAIDDAPPVITNTAPAGGWAGSKTTTITLTDAKTPSGMQYSIGGGWVNYSAPFTYTFTANGSINVMARDKWGCTSGNKTISASQIDTTAPTAPSIAKSPTAAWHKDNVTITINGGSDVGSGINRYQYNISGGAWQNYSAPFAVASSAAVNARTVDNVGLVSGGSNTSVNIDRITPTGTITYNKAWTKNDVELRFTAADFGGSNVAWVRAGAGGWVAGATTTQTVSENGSYSFTVEDNAGNPQTVTEAVACIDKVLPVVNEINFIKTSDNLKLRTLFNKQLEIDIKTRDNASGIHTIEYQLVEKGAAVDEGAWLPYSAAIKPRVEKRFSGAVAARCTDVASNVSAVLQADVTAEDTPPTAVHTLSTTEWTNGTVNIHLEAMDDLSGVASITLPDGRVVQGASADYIVSINGTYRFIVTDKCGNILEYDVVVSSIDLTPPTATHTITPNAYTNQPVKIGITATDDASGVASITLPDDTVVQGDIASYTAVANGVYRFVVTDNAGNVYNYDVTADKLDFVQPKITSFTLRGISDSPVKSFVRSIFPSFFTTQVELLVTAEDDYSGIETIEYQVTPRGAVLDSGDWRVYDSGKPPLLEKETDATVAVRTTDNANNVSAVVSKDAVIDGSAPVGSHSLSTAQWCNTYVIITVKAQDLWTKAKYITLPDGSITEGDTATFRVVRNGNYEFILTDELGNSGTYIVPIDNIEEVYPTPPKLGVGEDELPTDEMYVPDDIELGWERDTIDVKSLAQSGIEKYQYTSTLREHEQITPEPMARRARSAPPAKQWKDCGGEIIVNDEGVWDVQVRAVSYAGNISGISNYVLKNDYNPPTGTAEVSTSEIKFMAVDDLSGVKSIACEHDKATTVTLGSEITCRMAETETHIYTVTDNAGLIAEIPVEYIRPNDDVSTGGSLVPKDEIFVVGDEPTPSIPLPLPQGDNEVEKVTPAQSGTASGDKANDNETYPRKKDEANEPKNSTADGTDKSSNDLLSQLANFMRGLLNSLIKLLQRLVAWFNSLPLALRVVLAVSWWLLVLLIIYYIYRRVKKARADKRGE